MAKKRYQESELLEILKDKYLDAKDKNIEATNEAINERYNHSVLKMLV